LIILINATFLMKKIQDSNINSTTFGDFSYKIFMPSYRTYFILFVVKIWIIQVPNHIVNNIIKWDTIVDLHLDTINGHLFIKLDVMPTERNVQGRNNDDEHHLYPQI